MATAFDFATVPTTSYLSDFGIPDTPTLEALMAFNALPDTPSLKNLAFPASTPSWNMLGGSTPATPLAPAQQQQMQQMHAPHHQQQSFNVFQQQQQQQQQTAAAAAAAAAAHANSNNYTNYSKPTLTDVVAAVLHEVSSSSPASDGAGAAAAFTAPAPAAPVSALKMALRRPSPAESELLQHLASDCYSDSQSTLDEDNDDTDHTVSLTAEELALKMATHKPARGRRRRLQLAQMSEAEKEMEQMTRLQRNRMSARDCRLRKKAKINGLQERICELEQQNALLQQQVRQLLRK